MTTAPATADTAAPASDTAQATAPASTPNTQENPSTSSTGAGATEASTNESPKQQAEPSDEKERGTPTNEFKLPDEYKGKPWAAKIKTQDDLYKQLENMQGLIGKKHLTPDFEKATPEEIQAYYDSVRPKDAAEYALGEGTPEETAKAVQGILHKNGISKHQGNAIIAEYQAIERAQVEAATSAEGFTSEMEASFGKNYQQAVASVTKETAQHLSDEDKQLIESMPNKYLGAVYRMTASMLKAYGVSETGAAGNSNPAPVQPADMGKVRAELRTKIAELDKRPHTVEERQSLINQLDATYRSKK